MDKPPDEYGEWVRGNAGQVGRTVTRWIESFIDGTEWMPVVTWEPHPDEQPRRRHPVRKISYQRFWREVTGDGKRPCALADGNCGGGIDAHHYVPKRRIDVQLGGKYMPASIAAKQDSRNGVALCRHHHDQVENPVNGVACPRPPLLDLFLVEHGLRERTTRA